MPKSEKGSVFEREISVKLSEWFTYGENSDVFWRSSGSGARAKVRGRKGKTTSGQHADIAAIDPIGRPLINLIMLELKCGYTAVTSLKKGKRKSGLNFHDLVDRDSGTQQELLREWLEQVSESKKQAKAPFWMLIWQRDRSRPVIITTSAIKKLISGITTVETKLDYQMQLQVPYNGGLFALQVFPLDWLWGCDSEMFLRELTRLKVELNA
jgi:hypothetical protein